MNAERNELINRTEMAADRAESSGYFETANALREIAITLRADISRSINLSITAGPYLH